MDEKTLNEAVENISLIKGVIDRTSKSFIAFSRIFIYWGILFILSSIIGLIMNANKERLFKILHQHPSMGYIFPVGVIGLLAVLIYILISKNIPLVGLEKHLMKLWILILIMNVLPHQIRIVSTGSKAIDMSKIVIESNNFSMMLFSLAIALIVTALFTGYNHLRNLGVIYIAISVIYAFFRLPSLDGTFIQVICAVPLPFTFIYTGFFLKSKQIRGI